MKIVERMPSVTVCIVTFNSAHYIRHCVQAVQRQTWSNITTIIVDNASMDDTVETILATCNDVRILRNDHNRGFAAGQNQAISSSESDYVLVLNPDVVLDPDYISVLVQWMEDTPGLGSATGCLTLASNPDRVDSTGLKMSWIRKASERGAGDHAAKYSRPAEVFGVSGAAAMYSRKMINQVSIEGQFFDEEFFAYKEDVDVAWRAKLLGWTAWYEPGAQASHVRQWGEKSQRKKIPLKIRRHSYQNRYLTILKNECFDLNWWIRLPALICYEVVLNGYLLIRDPKVLGGSWLNLIKIIPSIWRKRQIIKAKQAESRSKLSHLGA